MSTNEICTDHARVLAELLDRALADKWQEGEVMALLWQASEDPDDLRLAVKDLERSVEAELRAFDEGWSYLAAAHSTVTRRPPIEFASAGEDPVRITVAVDHQSQSGVLRHRNGATQWFGAAVPLPVATLMRSLLDLERAA